MPPAIKAFGTIANAAPLTLRKAFDKYGARLGYESVEKMIEYSAAWTSSVALSSNSSIFCVEINDLKHTRDIRVDKELEPIGILFDYQHIVTGKGLNGEQTSALLQLVNTIDPDIAPPQTPGGRLIKEAQPNYESSEPDENEFASESARYLESHMQWFIFNNLPCLGISGVKLFDPSIQRETQGKYRTDEVGEIDLLLKSANDDIYVIELKKAGTDKTVGQICRYMGWVRHRLAKDNQRVRGIIVTQDYDYRLSYAASVVNDLTVKRIQISFNSTSETPELPE